MLKYNVRKPIDWNDFWGKVQLGMGVILVALGLYGKGVMARTMATEISLKAP